MDKRQTLWALDIETASQGKRANTYTDNAHYALGNVKDPAKIEAKLAEKRDDARRKHALHWGTGKVVSVALVDVFGEKDQVCAAGHDEVAILINIAKHIKGTRLIGKNSFGFDFPFLVGRYMAHGLPVPRSLREKNMQYDVDTFFGWSASSGQRGKLELYAHGLEMDGKMMDGSRVPQMYNEILALEMEGGDATAMWQAIREYNLDDTRKVAQMARLYYGEDE